MQPSCARRQGALWATPTTDGGCRAHAPHGFTIASTCPRGRRCGRGCRCLIPAPPNGQGTERPLHPDTTGDAASRGKARLIFFPVTAQLGFSFQPSLSSLGCAVSVYG